MRQPFRLFAVLFVLFTCAAAAATAENRLAGASSLYLRQHADQPVNWYPWGDDALAKARATGKPIFVSVGYAACHWCHVMARESFEDVAIATLLNTHFISVKIDRERRPDLDEQFSLVTTALTGTSGWPNSVFLTPKGEPFYAGGYFPPAAFSEVLRAVDDAWQNDRDGVIASATEVAALLRSYFNQTAELANATDSDITAAALRAIDDLDDFNGGFGNGLKFPRETLLLFLLDQVDRTGDQQILGAVTLTLDGMLRGGIHDHAGGGFHRYATDPAWQIPHFEKMLYNQALMARVLIRAHALTGNADYARAARRTLDYVLRDLSAPGGGFYSAQDADSVLPTGAREEGHAYTWTPDGIDAALADMPGLSTRLRAIIATELGVGEHGPIEGRSTLSLIASPLDTAASLGLSPDQFDALLDRLRRARIARPAPIRDEKIILSWNAEMITTLAEAATMLDDPAYQIAARRAVGFLLDELGSGDAKAGLKRIYFDGRADVPAQLTDFAALGNALIALHDHGVPVMARHGEWLALGETLGGVLRTRFDDPDRALRMTARVDGLGPFRPIDDTELASGNALALGFLAALDRRHARSGDYSPRLAARLVGDALALPAQRAGILGAVAAMRHGPSGPVRVSSGGAARVVAQADRAAGQVSFRVSLAPGWHLNAHEPLEEYLIGVDLRLGDHPLPATAYPRPVTRNLGFSETALALYETGFTLGAPLPKTGRAPRRAVLSLQACNDEQCLPPDDMVFWFW